VPLVYVSNLWRRNKPEDAANAEPQYGKDTIIIRNPKQGEVEVVKLGKDNNTLLPGATFELRNPNGKVIDSWVTDDKPYKITGLNEGKYFIIETKAPAGHQKTDEVIEITVDKDGKVTKKVISKNEIPVVTEPKKSEKKLTEKTTTFTLRHTKQKPIAMDGKTYNIVKVGERPVVILDIAGVTVPFYMTTGLGGKNLKAGWYPFFGFGKDGWINKTHREDMSNYYEKFVGPEVAKMWSSIATDLANTYGTDYKVFEPTEDPTTNEKPLSSFQDKFEDYLNKQLMIKPVNNTSNASATLEQNIKDMGTKVLLARNSKEESGENLLSDKVELVNVSSERLKEIFEKYPTVGKLFELLSKKGKIKKLTFDNTTFVSQNKGNGEISIGTKYQDGMRYQQNTLFPTGVDDIARKLAHEMMHSVVPESVNEHSAIGNLYLALKQLRAYDSKKGLSILVSKYPGRYNKANIQATEDMTELFAMYLIDPNHLKNYLTYLSTIPNSESDRLGLKKISPKVADAMYKQIDGMLKDFVKGGDMQVDKKIDKGREVIFNEK
jgi:hypothetical protein